MRLDVLYGLKDVLDGCCHRQHPGFKTILNDKIQEIRKEYDENELEIERV